MTMNESDLRAYQQYLKEAISLARTLSKHKNPTIYELGHYLADNVLSKVCMVIAKRNDKDDLIFENGKSGRTYNFPVLYKKIIEKFYPNDLPKYEEIVKTFHSDRGFYQHSFESLGKIFRRTEAERYVNFVIDVMKKTEILGKYDNLPLINIYSNPFGDFKIYSKKKSYQKFYDTLKDISNENRVNAIYIQIKRIQYNIEKDFNMLLHNNRGMKSFHNSNWDLHIRKTEFQLYNKKTNKGYSSNEPDKNLDALNEFLDYYRKILKDLGILIKE